METITLFTHGRSRGNPGPAAIGVRIVNANGVTVQTVSEAIGNATDQYAEYFAVMRALQVAKELFAEKTEQTTFELKISGVETMKQLNSEAIITNPGLVPYFIEIHNLRVAHFPLVKVIHLRLELNKDAEQLVTEALDA